MDKKSRLAAMLLGGLALILAVLFSLHPALASNDYFGVDGINLNGNAINILWHRSPTSTELPGFDYGDFNISVNASTTNDNGTDEIAASRNPISGSCAPLGTYENATTTPGGNTYSTNFVYDGNTQQTLPVSTLTGSTTIYFEVLATNGSGIPGQYTCTGGSRETQVLVEGPDYATLPSPAITLLNQYEGDASTSITEGETIATSTIIFKGVPQSSSSSDPLQFQIEIEPLGVSFVNSPTETSTSVTAGETASITVSDMPNNQYHWQGRTLDMMTDATSSWMEYGNVGNKDFYVEVPANATTSLEQLDHSNGVDNSEKIVIPHDVYVNSINLWVGSNFGAYNNSQSYLTILTDDDGSPGTQIATSSPVTVGVGFSTFNQEEGYVFSSPVALTGGDAYWLAVNQGPSGTTNPTTVFGSNDDPYPDAVSPGDLNDMFFQFELATPTIAPSSLQQYQLDATTTIAEGATTTESSVIFGATLESPTTSTMQLQVEIEPSSTPFANTSTVASVPVSSGGFTTISSPVLANGQYHWQARVMDSQGTTSTWQTFGSNATGTDFIVHAMPAESSQPVENPICPGLSSSTKNLIFITHGWNGDAIATDTTSWVIQMKDSIESNLPDSSWGVCAYDWHQGADTLSPWDAFNNAENIGINIGYALAQQNYTSIHFIAHSAGANLIQYAANFIQNHVALSSRPKMQLTFLDAYDPAGDLSSYGDDPQSSSTNWWAEQYVDTRNVFFGALDDTNIILSNAYNFNITALDPNQDEMFGENILAYGGRIHAWPHVWYGSSTIPSSGFTYGYPLSLEENSDTLPLQYFPGADCVLAIENGDCVTTTTSTSTIQNVGDYPGSQLAFEDAGSGNIATSTTGTITYPDANTVTLETGSPVWIQITTTTTDTANVMKFDYDFQSASGSQGMLGVFVDNQPVDEIDERVAATGTQEEKDVWIGDLDPGAHTLGFRLDPNTGVHSVVSISNVQLGVLEQTTSTYSPDLTPPVITVSTSSIPSSALVGATTTVTYSFSDSGTGVATSSATFNGTPFASGDTLTFDSAGTSTLVFSTIDNAGNPASEEFDVSVHYATGTIGSWSTTTAFPGIRTQAEQGAVAYNGYIYSLGGAVGASLTSTVFYAPINSNGALGSWSTTTALPTAFESAAVAYNGYMYMVGGQLTGPNAQTSTVLYAPINTGGTIGSWTKATSSLPVATGLQSAVAYNGYLYSIAGFTGTVGGSGGNPTSTVYYAKINSNGALGPWLLTTTYPHISYETPAVTYNGYLYGVGYYSGGSSITSTVYYAPITASGTLGSWSPTTRIAVASYFQPAFVNSGYLYSLGGWNIKDSPQFISSTISYAPINGGGTLGSSAITTPLPTILTQGGGVAYNNYAYYIGGYNGTANTSTVYYAPIH